MQETPVNRVNMRVRARDTDLNGTVYHGAYFDCFEAARVEVFRRLGYTYQRCVKEGFSPVVRRVEAEFLKPAYMDDLLQVDVTAPSRSAASLRINYAVSRGTTVLATGSATFVFIGNEGKAIRIPISLVECLDEHQDVLDAGRKSD